MKRLALIFALLCSASAWASIAYVSASGTTCHATSAGTGSTCTLAGTTTANNDVIVGLSWKTTTRSIDRVVGSASGSFFVIYAQTREGTDTASAILVCRHCPALTTVTPTFSGTTLYELNVAEYSGVVWMGITGQTTATSTHPGLTFTTGDANDWIVVETSSLANNGIPTANTGNLRQANRTGTNSSNVAAALIDNTGASAGSVTADATITSGAWSASGVELRTTAPQTYIWPDCDSTHPCVLHHRDTMAMGNAGDTLTTPFYIRFQPSLAGNLLKLTITHLSANTISTVASYKQDGTATGDTWLTGATLTDATNGIISEIRYVCGGTTGTAEIRVTFSGPIAAFDMAQFSYDEISGIATSSCSDGTSGTTATAAPSAVNPGSITPSQTGDLIYTYTIDTRGAQENGFPTGWIMPDDQSALLWVHMYDNFAQMVSVYGSTSAINPTMYVNSIDPNQAEARWNTIAQAFKASSGAGTQPPAGHAWVVRNEMYRNANPDASYLPISAFPTNGNVAVVNSTQHVDQLDLSTLMENQGGSYSSNTVIDTSFDPQQYTACFGSSGYSRDRAIAWTMTSSFSTPVELYDIAGAKTSTGTGCVGTRVNNKGGTQAAANNANIVSSSFSTPFSFTPSLNGSAYSLMIVAEPYGAGPPKGPCISGGVTPPSCTGNMSNFVFTSIWASGMGDGSHYSNGDMWGYWYSNSTSAYSIDTLMANSADQPGGGSAVAIAVTEILGQPAAAVRKRVTVTTH